MNEREKIEITAPILFIGFNRPEITKQTFNYLRNAEVRNLYIAIDGPREDESNDYKLVSRVKNIVKKVDWECDARHRFNEKNKGAEVTVSSAISWVLEKEEYVIVLEDDIIAPKSFLKFIQDMLRRYQDCERIGTVTGCNFTPISLEKDNDYFFAKYGHHWGWGTWQRAWEGYNLNVDIPDRHVKLEFLRTITNTEAEAEYFREKFRKMKERGAGNNPWDYVADYYHRINNRLSIIPRVNLTSNIGTHGLHTNGKSEHHFREFDENFEVKKHPDKIRYNKEYDIYHFNNYINEYMNCKKPIYKRAINKAIRVIKRYV